MQFLWFKFFPFALTAKFARRVSNLTKKKCKAFNAAGGSTFNGGSTMVSTDAWPCTQFCKELMPSECLSHTRSSIMSISSLISLILYRFEYWSVSTNGIFVTILSILLAPSDHVPKRMTTCVQKHATLEPSPSMRGGLFLKSLRHQRA